MARRRQVARRHPQRALRPDGAGDHAGGTWQEPDVAPIAFDPDDGATLERVWQLAPDPGDAEVVWAGCEPTSVWRSEDGGRSFDLVRGLWDHPHRPDWWPGAGGAAVHTVLPEPDGSAALTVAMSTGGVYRSSDGGSTWSPANRGISAPYMPGPEPEYGQCVHKIAPDAGSPAVLYAQNHGGVYRTDDAGGQWSSIADGLPGDFGFVVLTHPRRAGTVWVVPLVADAHRMPPDGRLRMHRSTDGGRSWQPNRSGLPDASWVSVLRDAADVRAPDDGPGDGAATLAFGTRDGCVYLSTDDGDTFAGLASHLPDVLCVRLA